MVVEVCCRQDNYNTSEKRLVHEDTCDHAFGSTLLPLRQHHAHEQEDKEGNTFTHWIGKRVVFLVACTLVNMSPLIEPTS